MPSDLELFEHWRDGDRAAGEALFERHFDAVYRMFRHKVGDSVDDLVQRTFLACVEYAPRVRDASSFRTYLLTIARNELYMYLRRKGRIGDRMDPGVTCLEDVGPSPSQVLHHQREQNLLLKALRRVPLESQVLLELKYWERMTGPELAEVLALPEGTVRSRLRRAKQAVEEVMAELAGSPELLQSTLTSFDSWAESLRDEAGTADAKGAADEG